MRALDPLGHPLARPAFLVGLCVPRDTRTGRVLAVLLTAGTLVQGAWLYAAPIALLPAGNLGRRIGFVVGSRTARPTAQQ